MERTDLEGQFRECDQDALREIHEQSRKTLFKKLKRKIVSGKPSILQTTPRSGSRKCHEESSSDHHRILGEKPVEHQVHAAN